MFFLMKNKTQNIIGMLLLLGALSLGAVTFFSETPSTSSHQINEATTESTAQIHAELVVEDTSFVLTLESEKSVLDAMKILQEEQDDFSFTGSDSEFGFFVETINNVKNDQSTNSYWSLYINGEMAMVGVSDAIIQEGDIITWKYEQFDF